MTDKEKYDFIDHVVHLTIFVEDRLLDEHGGEYSKLEEDGIDSNEYYRIITERVINILKKNNNYMQEEPVSKQKLSNSSNIGKDCKDEHVSEELDKAAKNYAFTMSEEDEVSKYYAFLAGSKWQKKHLWKPADGDDLPEIDREVIALLDNGKVVFAHRPPEFWDGKNIITGKVTRNYPKTYDKGGWNIPNIKYWLDVKLPKEIEL